MTRHGMEVRNSAEKELESRLDAALSAAPAVAVPEDFAARVMQALPPRKLPVRAPMPRIPASPSVGYRVSLAALAVLAVVMVAAGLAMGAAHPVVKLAVESTFAGEFALLMVWVARRPRVPR